jgi:UDP-N-acetylmuramoylalanine--D-glutamate ligase
VAKTAGILGFGTEGESSYRYLLGQGYEVTIHDADPDKKLPAGVKSVLGPDYLKRLDSYDVVVRSPGLKPWEIKTKARVTTNMGLFFERCPARIIGVTGTKGKGTTTTLIARILGEAGWRTWVGGNIGKPPLDFLSSVRASHLVVLEMSSFQLMDLPVSPHIAVCLMIAPEHMDWHRNMREYVSAKGNIFWHQQAEDVAIYDAKNEYSSEIAQLSPGIRVPYLASPGGRIEKGKVVIEGVAVCRTDEVGLLGPHNLENICAALTASWDLIKRNPDPAERAIRAFTGLEHRLEFVGSVSGVRYYNDSFSTTPEAVIAAIRSFDAPKVIILGGSEKMSSYDELAKVVAGDQVRLAILVGETAGRIRSALEHEGFTSFVMGPRTMGEMVATARGLAVKGDVVLLSPGAASFGLFSDYKDRGMQFKAAVKELGAK